MYYFTDVPINFKVDKYNTNVPAIMFDIILGLIFLVVLLLRI